MVEIIAIPATLIGLYALWIVGGPDLLRLIQGVYHVRGQVTRHEAGSDGFTPVYEFEHDGVMREVAGFTAQATPKPAVGSIAMLSYPRRRPDLARTPRPFVRTIMYAGFAAWLAFFSDLWLRWL